MKIVMMDKKIDEYNTLKAHILDWRDAYERKVAKFGEPISAIYMRELIDATHRAKEAKSQGVAREVFIRSQSPVKDTEYPITLCAYCHTVKEPGVMCDCQKDKDGDTGVDIRGDTGDNGMVFCWNCFGWYQFGEEHICEIPREYYDKR